MPNYEASLPAQGSDQGLEWLAQIVRDSTTTEPFIQDPIHNPMFLTDADLQEFAVYSRDMSRQQAVQRMAELRRETQALIDNKAAPSLMSVAADALDRGTERLSERMFSQLDRVETRLRESTEKVTELEPRQLVAGAVMVAVSAGILSPAFSSAQNESKQGSVVAASVVPPQVKHQTAAEKQHLAAEHAARVKLEGVAHAIKEEVGTMIEGDKRLRGDQQVAAFQEILRNPNRLHNFDVARFKQGFTSEQLAMAARASKSLAPELSQLSAKERQVYPLMLALMVDTYTHTSVKAAPAHPAAPKHAAPAKHAAAPKPHAEHKVAKPAHDKHKLNPHAAIPKPIANEIEKQSHRSKHFTAAEIAAQIKRESSFRPKVESNAGAVGLGQIMPGTWDANKVDGNGDGKTSITDPADNLATSIEIMDNLFEKFAGLQDQYNWTDDDVRTATYMSYNVGPNKLVAIVESLGHLPTVADIGTHYTYTYDGISSDNVIKRETVEYPDKIQSDVDDYTDAENSDDDTAPAESTNASRVHSGEIPAAPAGTIDLGLHTGYHRVGAHGNGHTKSTIRLVAIPGFASSSSESHAGNAFSIPGADGNVIVNAEMAANVLAMFEAAKADGIELSAQSSFRSMPHQQALWRHNPNRAEVAYPGRSNHQEGKAIDFYLGPGLRLHATDYDTADGGPVSAENPRVAPTSAVYNWLVAHGHEYGLRQYPNEPWHWEFDPNFQQNR